MKKYYVIKSGVDGLTIVNANSSFDRWRYYETFEEAHRALIKMLKHDLKETTQSLKRVMKMKAF
jgi:hypothetical protein